MEPLLSILQNRFGFRSFRPNQEAVCQAAAEGRDVLLVMPTGSGKSLCYQLPGVARGGTTLVISPLIALMEDQVAKLQAQGLPVARIHSGRDRAASRQACFDYLNGKLEFLFIAPERLAVPGFPEMLAKRKPTLVAVDEAHCISLWGHDFRPDYRMLGQYLPLLRPASVMALTATATPTVQNDIERQLGLVNAARFIQGFRRENIAVEIVEAAQGERVELVRALLKDPANRPAIVYVPSRVQAETFAMNLTDLGRAAAYHAGLDNKTRTMVQDDFLAGRLSIMAATIAFGMGVDKPDIRTIVHVALPGSVERYYQEIGRAGRDGLPSRAVLVHSYADRRNHDFFFEQNYPDVSLLDEIFKRLKPAPLSIEKLMAESRLEEDAFGKALERLAAYGGAVVDDTGHATAGNARWRNNYLFQCDQKAAQLEAVIQFAQSHDCRMASLVRYFGDRIDSLSPCGICDFCAPQMCQVQKFEAATQRERSLALRILKPLYTAGSKATGRLYSDVFPNQDISRDDFENLLGALARAGLVKIQQTSFEKAGKEIPYSVAKAVGDKRSAGELPDLLLAKANSPSDVPRVRRKRR